MNLQPATFITEAEVGPGVDLITVTVVAHPEAQTLSVRVDGINLGAAEHPAGVGVLAATFHELADCIPEVVAEQRRHHDRNEGQS